MDQLLWAHEEIIEEWGQACNAHLARSEVYYSQKTLLTLDFTSQEILRYSSWLHLVKKSQDFVSKAEY